MGKILVQKNHKKWSWNQDLDQFDWSGIRID